MTYMVAFPLNSESEIYSLRSFPLKLWYGIRAP